MSKFERFSALLGAFGCFAFALFILMSFFSVPVEGRLSPLAACLICTALLWGSAYGVYIVIRHRG